jgi:hypothetical protein
VVGGKSPPTAGDGGDWRVLWFLGHLGLWLWEGPMADGPKEMHVGDGITGRLCYMDTYKCISIMTIRI